MDFLYVLKVTVSGLFPLYAIAAIGAFLTHKHCFDPSGNLKLSGSMANFFLPVLSIFAISSTFKLSNLDLMWPILAGPFIAILLYSAIGYCFTVLMGVPKSLRFTLTGAIAFPNFTLSFILMQGICSPYGPLQGNEYCEEYFSYASLLLFPLNLIMWSYGFTLVGLDKQHQHTEDSQLNEPLVIKQESQRIHVLFLKSLMMPNPVACVIGIVLAVIPGFQGFFYDKTSMLYCVPDTAFTAINSAVALAQMILGSYLHLIRNRHSDLTKTLLLAIAFTKVIVVPGVSIAIFYGLWKIGVFQDNLVMTYILYISLSAPTALNCMFFAQMHKINIDEIVQSMLWIYIFSIPAIILWTFIFFLIF